MSWQSTLCHFNLCGLAFAPKLPKRVYSKMVWLGYLFFFPLQFVFLHKLPLISVIVAKWLKLLSNWATYFMDTSWQQSSDYATGFLAVFDPADHQVRLECLYGQGSSLVSCLQSPTLRSMTILCWLFCDVQDLLYPLSAHKVWFGEWIS